LFEEAPPGTASTDTDESQRTSSDGIVDTDDDDESLLADLGFMMEGAQPAVRKVLEWRWPPSASEDVREGGGSSSSQNDKDGGSASVSSLLPEEPNAVLIPPLVQVVAHAVDDTPGAVQSGHYLWPGAKILVDYLVRERHQQQQQLSHHAENPEEEMVASVVELGSGCAVASLAALQLYRKSVQVVVCTDHDRGVLEQRARDSYESTMDRLLSSAASEDELNDRINNLASIPVLFEPLEWGSDADTAAVLKRVAEHTVDESSFCDLVLGTDLVYCSDVIRPLLATAFALMKPRTGRFLLSQSFDFDRRAEDALDETCEQLGLKRTVLWQNRTGSERVQEFRRYVS
jgi:predicted nicotinamide N-methyase